MNHHAHDAHHDARDPASGLYPPAWSKGLKERVAEVRHALKNALLPVLTVVGIQLPYLIGGAVIIEQIFGHRPLHARVDRRPRIHHRLRHQPAYGNSRRLRRNTHVLPNLMAPLIVIFTITLGSVIVTEAALAFSVSVFPLTWPPGGACSAGRGAATWSRPGPGALAGAYAERRRLGHQHVRGRPPRPARPEAQGRRRTLWWITEAKRALRG